MSKPQSLTKKLLPYVVYAIFPIALFTLFFYPFPLLSQSHVYDQFSHLSPISTTTSFSNSASSPHEAEEKVANEVLHPASIPSKEKGKKGNEIPSSCDYTNGEWVRDNKGPLYSDTNCGTIKDGRNCMSHGRTDKGYLNWRWKPRNCNILRFNPQSFLQILKGKHLAFVGDSMARNQLESLLCMLSSFSPPNLVYSKGDDNKFRRWHFPSHNVNVSIYWSPFLVKGIEKDGERNYNKLYLDSIDERWASDLDSIDMVVLSIGHWYLHPAIYHDGDLRLGCHALESLNCTEIGFYDVFAKAFNTTLKAIMQRKGFKDNGIDVIVTTFSPHHFEGEWDKLGACPKTKPYTEGEKALEGMDAEMRRVEVEEVKRAKAVSANANHDSLPTVRVEALDVTKLALLRPDGHPGPYMYPFPFANGIKERVQNDCVHWCLPGPIDTWNEILLDIMKRWHVSSMR